MLVDGLSRNMQKGKQTHLILLDFSKAFHKVSHEKLLQQLHFYGIGGGVGVGVAGERVDTLNWIGPCCKIPRMTSAGVLILITLLKWQTKPLGS